MTQTFSATTYLIVCLFYLNIMATFGCEKTQPGGGTSDTGDVMGDIDETPDMGGDTGEDTGDAPNVGEADSSEPEDIQTDVGGGEDTAGGDTHEPVIECDRYNTLGSFVVQTGEFGNGFAGELRTAPWPFLLDLQNKSEHCGFYTFAKFPDCGTPCPSPLVCGFGDQCRPMPDSIPVGKVTVTGTTPDLVLMPNEYGSYYTMENYPNLVTPGKLVTLTAEGEGEIGGFTLAAHGIAPLKSPTTMLTMVQGEPFTITWTPGENSPEDATMIVHLDIDHHAAQAAYVECEVPDNDGQLTIPAELVDALIEAGHSGIGTYVENAYMVRRSQSVQPIGDVCTSFGVESNVFIGVETQLKGSKN